MITLLTPEIAFPDPESAGPDGLLAVGGDLGVPRLLKAYSEGIFPWYNDEHPILWWSPDPRPVLLPRRLRLARRLRRYLGSHPFQVEADRDFQAVISACAVAERPGQAGTWLTADMIRAYARLHHAGHAHCVECRLDGRLAGGIYGVAVGRAFFGESMFHTCSHASKVAFAHLVWHLADLGFLFMDCQQATPHVMRFGAVEIPRRDFTALVRRAASVRAEPGKWTTPAWWSDPPAVKERARAS
ncbi:Leucyl/phenylalanyl-tRNA--protein transferase [Fundidesulfovibrio magnetotacticus]|uniref:Leucyl/phenylalanyl-tRNA--protein transferase n=1 Tax=Fundidesulfovibrio magnetotacticus TaxID=2730080 RepID=A0A6V8LUW1_9BACT|nr:leucyl/phenylalanyl-tRNA--protein transferase [Fundidesulfovibrio magnetotacticus]GFK95534.1 Leucyl/phenylalanyl-tRNA--protein transferase [Fundidesulfovibrio magnetotacticus]